MPGWSDYLTVQARRIFPAARAPSHWHLLCGYAMFRRHVRDLVNVPAFDFDERRFDWGDVIVAAIGWGEWQRLERSLAEDLARARDSLTCGEPVDAGALGAAETGFRRAHGLLAGEEYLRWLAERSLSSEEVRAHLTRRLLRDRPPAPSAAGSEAPGAGAGQLAESIRAEAILSGRLQAWAERLARCAAAARGLARGGEAAPSESAQPLAALLDAAGRCAASGISRSQAGRRAPRVAALQTADREFRARAVTPERIERCLAEHRLDWQRLVWEEVTFAGEGAAREAFLLLREDGMALEEVASLARVMPAVREAYSDQAPALAGLLAAANPGELVGPLAGENGWRLVRLRERTPPQPGDGVLRERASAELVEDALSRYLGGRVTWHGWN